MALAEKVKQIIADSLGVDLAEATPEARFDDLGADSLDVVELVMTFEETFSLEITDDEVEAVTTVADAIALLERKGAKG